MKKTNVNTTYTPSLSGGCMHATKEAYVYTLINKFKKIIHRSNYTKKYHKIDKYNHKKILCQNFIINNTCSYDTKCLYAHSLSEQKIDIKRKKIFELIKKTCKILGMTRHTYKAVNAFI